MLKLLTRKKISNNACRIEHRHIPVFVFFNNNMHSIAATDSNNTFHSWIQFSDIISHTSIIAPNVFSSLSEVWVEQRMHWSSLILKFRSVSLVVATKTCNAKSVFGTWYWTVASFCMWNHSCSSITGNKLMDFNNGQYRRIRTDHLRRHILGAFSTFELTWNDAIFC
jgi:hypothetical protein